MHILLVSQIRRAVLLVRDSAIRASFQYLYVTWLFPVGHGDAIMLENLIHTDLCANLEVDLLKKYVSEYAEAKELAIRPSKVTDTQNIKHIAENERVIGDGVEKAATEWNNERVIGDRVEKAATVWNNERVI